MTERPCLAGVELGGTKTIILLAEDDAIVARETIPTGSPLETLTQARETLLDWHTQAPLRALGIASFGPLQLDHHAADFGHMHATPKPGWSGVDIAGQLTAGLPCPWTIDTDVNGGALAEHIWGAGGGHNSFWYITIGTGVGGGLLIDGKPVHGAMHPEIGHIRTRRQPGDAFPGHCPFHGDCIEGLVSGPALAARFGTRADLIPDDDPRWDDVAADLAELVGTLLLTTAASAVLLGGSVALNRPLLLPTIHRKLLTHLAGYLPTVDEQSVKHILALAALGEDAGPLGAIALARLALDAR